MAKLIAQALIAFFVAGQVHAEAAEKTPPCTGFNTILQEYSTTLHFEKPADREKGYQDLPSATNCAIEYGDKKHHDPAQFVALVQLAAQALPYDEEAGMAESVSNLMAEPELNRVYRAALAQVTDSCRRNYLATAVELENCLAYASKTSSCDESKVSDFRKCVGVKEFKK